MQILALKTKFQKFDFAKKKGQHLGLILDIVGSSLIVIFSAYFIAAVSTSVMIPFVAGTSRKPSVSGSDYEHPRIEKTTNYRDFRTAVLARNLFNSEGVLPEEPDPSESVGNAFDPNGICQKPTVNIELMGIIATGNPDTTLATVREKGYTIADIYKAGDKIVGQEQASIHSIEEDKVILNNNGVKECLDLNTVKSLASTLANSGTAMAATPIPSGEASDDPAAQCPSSSSTSLESSYVEDALGPGFSKILEAGRLVPFHRDNAMVGFKLIGVRGGSLWARTNLASGDVITAVNGQSMAQPEKGFAVYEALQADKSIRVEFLKAGKTPCILNVEIK